MAPTAENPYETGAVPSATDLWSVDPNGVAAEWTEENDPLTPDELATIADAFVTSVGTAARETTDEGVTEDEYLRVADAESFGRFAHERDVALLEPADDADPTYGYLYGYTTEGNSAVERGVPLLVCLPGPLAEATAWLEEFSATVADMPGLGIVRP